MTPFGAMPIVFTESALVRDRLFPASKHRSKRVHKKLVKRLGAEFGPYHPGAFRIDETFYVHPALRSSLEYAAAHPESVTAKPPEKPERVKPKGWQPSYKYPIPMVARRHNIVSLDGSS